MAEGGKGKDGSAHPVEGDSDSSKKGDDVDTGEKDDKISGLEKLRQFFQNTLGLSSKTPVLPEDRKLKSLSLEGVVEFMKSDQCKNVLVMCGAGVSTSAGIPDFRSPGSGIYANLQKYNLPDPQCIFEIDYFRENPMPFYSLAKEILPKALKPTPCHYFIRLLHEKGLLLRVYTQNVDTLERISGIPDEKIVEAHGTFNTSHCLNSNCRKKFELNWMREKVQADEIPKCDLCGSVIKPDIVFFGENLPKRFFSSCATDFPKCDLLIIMGTSLFVQPFASLIEKVRKDVPRLLINKEKAGEADPFMKFLGHGFGMDFESKHNYRDVAWLGNCDNGAELMADLLGWKVELKELIKSEHKKIDDGLAVKDRSLSQ